MSTAEHIVARLLENEDPAHFTRQFLDQDPLSRALQVVKQQKAIQGDFSSYEFWRRILKAVGTTQTGLRLNHFVEYIVDTARNWSGDLSDFEECRSAIVDGAMWQFWPSASNEQKNAVMAVFRGIYVDRTLR